jgi:hypothetical protein
MMLSLQKQVLLHFIMKVVEIITTTVYFDTSDATTFETWNLHALILKWVRQISSGNDIFTYLGGVKTMLEYYNLLELMDAVAPQVCLFASLLWQSYDL